MMNRGAHGELCGGRHRRLPLPYRRLGVEKGDERGVIGVDHGSCVVLLDGSEDGLVHWKPAEIGGCRGGTEVYGPRASSSASATASAGPATMAGSAASIARPRR